MNMNGVSKMNLFTENQVSNNAFYFEVCMLNTLKQMGYLSEQAVKNIVDIAEEDYNATLYLL